MLFELSSYINFLLKSQNQHGLHSPFVYDLVTNCFYDKADYPEYDLIKEYRNDLLRDRSKIKVTDFGAGSRVFKSDLRPVHGIAKTSGTTLHRAKFLFRLCKYLDIKNALELGTSLGIASVTMAANSNTSLTTIEGCPGIAEKAQQQFEKFKLNNIQLRNEEFDGFLKNLSQTTKNSELRTPHYDLVFLDGNHQKQATLDYIKALLPYTHNDSLFIFDDIHWSPEMEEAWEEIKKHPKVQVTIDTFKWGLVFFRKEQAKQDFIIRL